MNFTISQLRTIASINLEWFTNIEWFNEGTYIFIGCISSLPIFLAGMLLMVNTPPGYEGIEERKAKKEKDTAQLTETHHNQIQYVHDWIHEEQRKNNPVYSQVWNDQNRSLRTNTVSALTTTAHEPTITYGDLRAKLAAIDIAYMEAVTFTGKHGDFILTAPGILDSSLPFTQNFLNAQALAHIHLSGYNDKRSASYIAQSSVEDAVAAWGEAVECAQQQVRSAISIVKHDRARSLLDHVLRGEPVDPEARLARDKLVELLNGAHYVIDDGNNTIKRINFNNLLSWNNINTAIAQSDALLQIER